MDPSVSHDRCFATVVSCLCLQTSVYSPQTLTLLVSSVTGDTELIHKHILMTLKCIDKISLYVAVFHVVMMDVHIVTQGLSSTWTMYLSTSTSI